MLQLVTNDRLAKIRDSNMSLEAHQARTEFQLIPVQVEKETRNARNGKSRGQNWFNCDNDKILVEKAQK
jgi:hypothetical protein